MKKLVTPTCRSVGYCIKDPVMESPPKRVVLWAPPRTLSTAVERSLIEHKAIQVFHEPFGIPHYWSSEAASSRNASDRRTATTFSDVAQQLWRTPPAPGKQFIFTKNLAYYFAPHCLPRMGEMLEGDYSQVVHSFIIRHPAKAVSSLYYKSCIDNEKTGYSHFDRAEAGFTAMRDILEHVEQQPGAPPCVIIDADDLLDDPEGIMTAYCEAVGLPFNPTMLSWEPGPVKELESPWTGWTDDVINSSGITRRAKTSKLPQVETLPAEVQDTIAEAMPIYEMMHARRLRPAGEETSSCSALLDQVALTPTEATAVADDAPVPAEERLGGAVMLAPLSPVAERKPICTSTSVDNMLRAAKRTPAPVPQSPVGIRAVLSDDALPSLPRVKAA